jgi:lipopolysaccharide transport system permease protein
MTIASPTPLVAHSPRVIEPSHGLHLPDFRELWHYHELLYFLVWRDLKARFRQTALGVAWVLVRPILSMVVFTLVFGRLANMPSDHLPYPLFVIAALLPWGFFSTAVTAATGSIVGSAHLISKIYFPRVILPMVSVLAGLVEFAISCLLVFLMMAWYGMSAPLSAAVTLPLLFLILAANTLGFGLWLGTLNAKYRDVSAVIPLLVQMWMYATPVVYPLGLVPERYRWIVLLNPLTGPVEGFRAALFGTPWPTQALALSAGIGFALLATGLIFLRITERTLADTV